jgi:diguanylate cyclase (GGDEF)-like protein
VPTSRSRLYGLTGAGLALGAPAGLLALRAAESRRVPSFAWLYAEIAGDSLLYLYLLASTVLVFALFGHRLGSQADRLAELSIRDPLTGLPNARAFGERLAEECERATRYAAPLSLLLIDVDGLKRFNDDRGHSAGDQALKLVAAAVRGGSRVSDSLSRWGGDEFAVVAPNTDAAAARHLAERIRAALAEASTGHKAFPILTVSIGVTTWSGGDDGCRPANLRRSADEALYRAKRDGRNCVRWTTPIEDV